jgi:hypothetical protein
LNNEETYKKNLQMAGIYAATGQVSMKTAIIGLLAEMMM